MNVAAISGLNCVARWFVPSGLSRQEVLATVDTAGIAAHFDDLEFGYYHGIQRCFAHPDHNFLGIVVSNGAGCPRGTPYCSLSEEELIQTRWLEQTKAAFVAGYAAVVGLGYPSEVVKDPGLASVVDDLQLLLQDCPRIGTLYTHSLLDHHSTHVACALRTITAIRRLPVELRPDKVLGCEVWGGLDWIPEHAREILDVSGTDHLLLALCGVFDSQIADAKPYHDAVAGRLRANATFLDPGQVGPAKGVSLAVDQTPLVENAGTDPGVFVANLFNQAKEMALTRLGEVGGMENASPRRPR